MHFSLHTYISVCLYECLSVLSILVWFFIKNHPHGKNTTISMNSNTDTIKAYKMNVKLNEWKQARGFFIPFLFSGLTRKGLKKRKKKPIVVVVWESQNWKIPLFNLP